jgi:hypothetical protein
MLMEQFRYIIMAEKLEADKQILLKKFRAMNAMALP